MPQVGSGILHIIPSLDSHWVPGRQSRRSCCYHPFGPHPGHRACPLARNPSESVAAKSSRRRRAQRMPPLEASSSSPATRRPGPGFREARESI
jgi:hypothetical protein